MAVSGPDSQLQESRPVTVALVLSFRPEMPEPCGVRDAKAVWHWEMSKGVVQLGPPQDDHSVLQHQIHSLYFIHHRSQRP